MKKLYTTILLTLLSLNVFVPHAKGDDLKYKNVFIEWKKVRGAFGYRVEVKNDTGEIIITRDVKVNSVNLRIPEGEFQIRIGAMNRLNTVENFSTWKSVKITIKNPPPPPEDLTADKMISERETFDVKLKWKAPPGAAKERLSYILMKVSENEYIKLGTTENVEYLVKDLERGREYKFLIHSINQDGEESAEGLSIIIDDTWFVTDTGIRACFMKPMNRFGDLFEYGYGALLNTGVQDFIVSNLGMGIEGGLYYLKGKSSDGTEHHDADQSFILPLCVYAVYVLNISENFIIQPRMTTGYTWNKLAYIENSVSMEKTFWDPIISASINFVYSMNRYLFFNTGCEYGLIFESGGNLSFITAYAGTGVKFNL